MTPQLWEAIASKTNEHGYMSGIDRMSDRVKATAEIFTPTALVIEMMQQLLAADPDALAPGKTILDPACGDGQLLVPVKWYKVLVHGMSEAAAEADLYGVDIMRDNVDMTKQRLPHAHIVMGNTLDPLTRLEEQTDEERRLMRDWFSDVSTLEDFFAAA